MPVLMLLTPSSHRPRASVELRHRAPSSSYSVRIRAFCSHLGRNLAQLASPGLWRNPPYLVFILANGMSQASISIISTFVFEHVKLGWFGGETPEEAVSTELAWFPSLIGLGACTGRETDIYLITL